MRLIRCTVFQILLSQQLHRHTDIIANSMLKQIVFLTLLHQKTITHNYSMYPISPLELVRYINIFIEVCQTIYCTVVGLVEYGIQSIFPNGAVHAGLSSNASIDFFFGILLTLPKVLIRPNTSNNR